MCYYRDDTQHKSKFLPNAKKGVFLGFDDKKYSYIIMDIENNKMHYTNDVEFVEEEPSKYKYETSNYKDSYFSFMKDNNRKDRNPENNINEDNNINNENNFNGRNILNEENILNENINNERT